MISKSTLKLIRSLAIKKYRQKENLFLAEGDKIVLEVLRSQFDVHQLITNEAFLNKHQQIVTGAKSIVTANTAEIKKASLLQNPQNCLAICQLPENARLPSQIKDIALYLDGIQNPGNLGTIIRTCDWFNIGEIFCSPDTADLYNPKVIQASMGSFCRINVYYAEINKLTDIISNNNLAVLGAFPEGQSIYCEQLPSKILLVLGNEGKGIRKNTALHITKKINIPEFSSDGPESLNVAVANGIICSEFKRQSTLKNSIQNESLR